MMKNGVYFMVIAILVAVLFKILVLVSCHMHFKNIVQLA